MKASSHTGRTGIFGKIISGISSRYFSTLRQKILSVAVSGLVLTSIAYTINVLWTEHVIMKEEIKKRVEVVARLASRIGEMPLVSGNPDIMRNAISSLKTIPEVSFVAFYDSEMKLIVEDGEDIPPQKKIEGQPEMFISEDDDYYDLYISIVVVRAREDIGLFEETDKAEDHKEHTGWVRIGFTKAFVKKAERAIALKGMLIAVVFIIGSGILIYKLFSAVTRPLTMLSDATKNISNGKYPEIHFSAADEIGALISEFNRMSKTIGEREERLRENEKRLSTILNSIGDAVIATDREGHVILINPVASALTGCEEKEAKGKDIEEVLNIVNEETRAKIKNPVKQVLEKGSVSRLAGRTLLIAKDGTGIPIDDSSAPIKDEAGNVTGMVLTFHNIMERRKMEEELFQITHDWQDTFDTITDMITIHDKDFDIIRANKAAEKILRLPLLAGAKAKCYQYYHGTECPPERCPSCQSLKTGKPSTSEMYEPNLNMFIEIRAIPRFNPDGNLIGLIHVVRDISERNKLETQLRQAQKMEAIGQLAGGVAHDFNNFLTAIIGYGNLLQMKIKQDDPLMFYTKQILAASEKAANLTQSLLAFSKKQISKAEPVNINEIIKGIEKLLSRVIGEDIELRVTLAGDLTIMADSMQIEQVLMNLCTNARDAMPHGGTLIISTEPVELDKEFISVHGYGEPGMYALISVADTGKGIDENTRERIFEPFFTTKEVGKGTGLGLSIVYGIVKQHNGYINCYSELGKGTIFKIYLPAIKPVVREIKAEEVPEAEAATETVLLAEDEDEVRSLVKQILVGSGYKVIETVDGEDAVGRFMENKDEIDILLFDVIMPKMSGKEAYDRIKKIRPDIKLLLTSGYPADFISKEDIFEKKLDFISKPISPTALLKKMREVLAK